MLELFVKHFVNWNFLIFFGVWAKGLYGKGCSARSPDRKRSATATIYPSENCKNGLINPHTSHTLLKVLLICDQKFTSKLSCILER